MKYLVTGQHGFLGKRFVEKLRENNIEPILVEGDLLDKGKLDNVCDEDYLIVHFAGYIGENRLFGHDCG